MRRFLMPVCLIAVLVPAAAFSEETITLTYDFPAPRLAKDGAYTRVSMGDLPLSAEAGKPALPYRPLRVLVPRGREVAGVEVVPGARESLPGRHLVQPAERPVPLSFRGAVAPTAPDPSTYKSLSPFPPSLTSGVNVQGKSAYRLLLVNLNPVSYIPALGELSRHRSLTVRVRLRAATQDDAHPPARDRAGDAASLRGRVENPEALASYDAARGGTAPSAPLESYPHVIITSAALAAAPGPLNFQALRDHRASLGLPSTIVTTEYIYANFSGAKPNGQSDNQTRIRNFIAWARENWGTNYVLLGGYSGIVPVRYLRADGTDIPADMYYGNLDGTFDGNANGVYGEPGDGPGGGEVDLYAEVCVGRACVENPAEVANFVRKTIGYETSSGESLRRAVMVGEHLGFGGASEYATGSMEEIRLGSCSAGYCTKGFAESDFFQVSTLYDAPGYSWPKADLIGLMNSGVQILNHLGHANYTYDMKLSTSDLPSLANAEPFFVYSQGCMPGGFDTSNCFGETITAMEKGAFAAVLNARYGWGSYDSTAGPSQYYDREFWDALFGEGIRTLGRMNADSKEDNDFRIAGSCMRWCCYELNLFGDPAAEIRCVSSRGSVLLDAAAYAIPGTVTVTVTDADLDADPAVPDTAAVTIASGTETAPEVLVLTETGPSTKTFRGSIPLAAGAPAPGDGALQVADGDAITALYHDADRGDGNAADPTASATADGSAPAISNVACAPSAKFCVITWETDEPATGAVAWGASPPPSETAAAAGSSTGHSVRITGLAPLTDYFFSVTSSDAVGNRSTDTNGGAWHRFTTPDHGAILFVDDDEGDACESYFTSALDANGYRYDEWNADALGAAPAAGDLSPYQAVVWNCGYNYWASSAGITPEEEEALAAYLDDGGNLFLCGQDIIYDNVSDGFLADYLHVAAYTSDDITATARGVDGNRISDRMALALDPQFTNYSDSLSPGEGAEGVFETDGGTNHPYCATGFPAEDAEGAHRTVFFAFPFESVSAAAADPDNAKTVMDRVLRFLSPLRVTAVSPPYGLNDRPVAVRIEGEKFKPGVALTLGAAPLAADSVEAGAVGATIPPGVAAGRYEIAVRNADTMKGSATAQYAALAPGADDDGDGLDNAGEVLTHRTNPLLPDTDGDGLSDDVEINEWRTDPLLADSDGDGLSDGQEISAGIDPWKSDTDGDGVGDYLELMCGTDPLAADGRTVVSISFQPPQSVPPAGFATDTALGFDTKQYGWRN